MSGKIKSYNFIDELVNALLDEDLQGVYMAMLRCLYYFDLIDFGMLTCVSDFFKDNVRLKRGYKCQLLVH